MAAIDQAEKNSYVLIKFRYGDPTDPSYKAYTDWTSNIPGNPEFISTPNMEIEEAENHGHIDNEKTVNLAIPFINAGIIVDTFIQQLISGNAHSPVYVDIWEITKGVEGGDAGTQRYLFRGRVIQTTKNFRGNEQKAVISCSSSKSRMNVSLGLPAEHHCISPLYHPNLCGLSKSGKFHAYTVAEIDGKVIRTSTIPSQTGDYFFRGWAEYDGLRIDIQQWDGDGTEPDIFYLVRQPPAGWLNKSALFYMGCDKTQETCDTKFSNLFNIGCMGYAMLAYDPILEDPE